MGIAALVPSLTGALLEPLARKCFKPGSPLGRVLSQFLSLILEQLASVLHSFAYCLAPWPGAGPGAPVSLRVGLEALESSLAGAGVGIVSDGEVGLQPGLHTENAEGRAGL